MDVIKLMKREKEAVAMYEDTIIEFGAPTKTATDNARVTRYDREGLAHSQLKVYNSDGLYGPIPTTAALC